MTVRYILHVGNQRGVITNKEQVFIDIDRQVSLSFLLSSGKLMSGDYYAVLIEPSEREHKVKLDNGKARLPDVLVKNHVLRLYVVLVEDNKIVKRYLCQELKINDMNDTSKLTFEAGPDYVDLQSQYAMLVEQDAVKNERLAALEAENQAKTGEIAELKDKLNEAITGLNNLSERVEFIENNYNPLEV